MAEDPYLTTGGSSQNLDRDNTEGFESTENINVIDDNSSDLDWVSDASSLTDGDLEDYPFDERLQKPTEYFQELDCLESKVFENSMFQYYTVI
jgi:hypothetical protein